MFVAAGFAHGVLDGTPFGDAPVLRWSYAAIGAVGLGFYVYRELLARFFLSLHDYQVDAVRQVGQGLVEVALRPLGRPVDFVPGQFAMVYLEAKDGWHRHPFTISGSPREDVVRVTVKALGDYTSRLRDLIEPGMPAVIGGPHGRLDHARGSDRQVWIAAASASRLSSAGCARSTSTRRGTSTSFIRPPARRRSRRRSAGSPTATHHSTRT